MGKEYCTKVSFSASVMPKASKNTGYKILSFSRFLTSVLMSRLAIILPQKEPGYRNKAMADISVKYYTGYFSKNKVDFSISKAFHRPQRLHNTELGGQGGSEN